MAETENKSESTLRQTFAVPFWLALASAVGLLAALLGNGPLDWASWLMLGLPVLIPTWKILRR